ncbi:MAG: PhzF family phenazine biosynthesis protein [Anaerolineales bacterium]|nr:PhzF family phenazine biosynthesis protein [Anaerolineales bacterium]MCB0018398.1 PhzF family phenazine biosynthesis protein [Anaerolineales bacterium]MCB0029162.1 PhzF family phenazine biosynthesis protein [Anaerolineales bacterium]MCB8963286.1 PhzF family phenazine biosynthesis protein [Ardenticatenales bacterium]
MSFMLFQVDAFTTVPFAGNPAAVCLLTEARPDSWLQQVAAEMNLSETAFVMPAADGFALRWFTPAAEVDLCGHATLATAHILWETGLLGPSEPARFQTRSGLLTAERRGELIELDFPVLATTPAEAPPELLAILGVSPRYVGKFGARYLLELDDEAAVRALQPDFGALRTLPERGVVVTSATPDADYDFVSRYFAPWVGVNEDPVTGSVHCALLPFWAERLGRTELRAFQASARGGLLHLRLAGDRARLGGQAVTVLQGELVV